MCSRYIFLKACIIDVSDLSLIGMHAIKDKPVVVNGQIVIRPIMVVVSWLTNCRTSIC